MINLNNCRLLNTQYAQESCTTTLCILSFLLFPFAFCLPSSRMDQQGLSPYLLTNHPYTLWPLVHTCQSSMSDSWLATTKGLTVVLCSSGSIWEPVKGDFWSQNICCSSNDYFIYDIYFSPFFNFSIQFRYENLTVFGIYGYKTTIMWWLGIYCGSLPVGS